MPTAEIWLLGVFAYKGTACQGQAAVREVHRPREPDHEGVSPQPDLHVYFTPSASGTSECCSVCEEKQRVETIDRVL